MSRAALYIVSTPIGNLDDSSKRMLEILADADVIAAEDTRRAGQLLSRYGIKARKLISYYDQVEKQKAPEIVARMLEEESRVALISDAGTPCVSDPGFRLVAAAREKGIPVIPIPGASALLALVAASGLPSDRFMFIGFLPSKVKPLIEEVESWPATRSSIIFFESAKRIAKSLETISSVLPEAQVCLGRELTKTYEEIHTSSIEDMVIWVREHTSLKGEVAVMCCCPDPKPMSNEDIVKIALNAFKQGNSIKDVLGQLKGSGLSRSDLYALLLETKKSLEEV